MQQGTTFNGEEPRPEPGPTRLEVDGQMVLEEDQTLSVRLRLSYHVGDPFAVTLEFLGESRSLATWQLSRDVLAEGLRKPSGLGDVRIWPPCHCHDRTLLRILLQGSQGSAVIDLPVEPVRAWLRTECFGRVPAGNEGDLIDWDVELARLDGGN